jgi:hypothetical protein
VCFGTQEHLHHTHDHHYFFATTFSRMVKAEAADHAYGSLFVSGKGPSQMKGRQGLGVAVLVNWGDEGCGSADD